MDKTYIFFILITAALALLAGLSIELWRLICKIRKRKDDIWLTADADARASIEETINFLDDDAESPLSEQKRVQLRQIIYARLKREERANKELIKKVIMEEVIKQENIKKEKIKKEALTLIIKDVLGSFRKEFFKKIKKIIADRKQSSPKKRSSRSEQIRREAEKNRQRERERKEQENKEHERRKAEQEKAKAAEEEKMMREKEENERKQEDERKKKEREEKERKEREDKQKQQNNKSKTPNNNAATAKAAAVAKASGGR